MRFITAGLLASLVVLGLAAAGCGPIRPETYENCSGGLTCFAIADSCRTVGRTGMMDSMCTRPCVIGTDCPTSRNRDFGVCEADGLCYSACTLDVHCPVGWSCQSGSRGLICLPR